MMTFFPEIFGMESTLVYTAYYSSQNCNKYNLEAFWSVPKIKIKKLVEQRHFSYFAATRFSVDIKINTKSLWTYQMSPIQLSPSNQSSAAHQKGQLQALSLYHIEYGEGAEIKMQKS